MTARPCSWPWGLGRRPGLLPQVPGTRSAGLPIGMCCRAPRTGHDGRAHGVTVPAEASRLKRRPGNGSLTSRSARHTIRLPSAFSGVTLILPRTVRFSPLAGLLVLLLSSCGGHATVTGTHSISTAKSSSPHVGFNTSTPIVGTGPTSQPASGGGGGGGVSITLPGLPIGNTSPEAANANGYAECVSAGWLGQMPSGITLKVTSVVAAPPFMVVDLNTAGCSAAGEVFPACTSLYLSAADNENGPGCFVGVEWTGSGQPQNTTGYLEFGGELSCANADSATCQQIGNDILHNAGQSPMVSFDFCIDCGLSTPSTPAGIGATPSSTSSP
jgi:hypothetical protein